MYLSFDNSFLSIQTRLNEVLSQLQTPAIAKSLLTSVVGDAYGPSGSGPATLPSPLFAPPDYLATRSGTGAERTQTYAERATTYNSLLDQASGAGTTGGTDYVAANQDKYLAMMSPEQRAMWHLQQQVNRQAEAAALMAALEKARHDAMMAIIQKIG